MSALDALTSSFDITTLFFATVFVFVCAGIYTLWDNLGKDSDEPQQQATSRVLGTLKVVILLFFLASWYVINIYNGSYSFAQAVLPNLVALAAIAGVFPSMLQAWIIFDESYSGEYKMREYGVALVDVFMTAIGLSIQAGVEPANFLSYFYANPSEGVLIMLLSVGGNFLIESLVLRRLRINSMTEAEQVKFKTVPKRKRKKP